jgi:hypothetical protein
LRQHTFLDFPDYRAQGPLRPAQLPYTAPGRQPVKVKFPVESLMRLLTERHEIFTPPHSCAEICIIGIKLKLYPVSQAIQHGINHVVHFDKQTAIHTNAAHHSSAARFIKFTIGIQIQFFHYLLF